MAKHNDTESIAAVRNAERAAATDSSGTNGVRTLVFFRDRGILVLWLVMIAVFAFWAAPYFFTLANAGLVANSAALTAIFAAAVAFGIRCFHRSYPRTALIAEIPALRWRGDV